MCNCRVTIEQVESDVSVSAVHACDLHEIDWAQSSRKTQRPPQIGRNEFSE